MPEMIIPFAGCVTPYRGSDLRNKLVLAGLPDDSQSTFRRGPADAPQCIRAAYDGRCFNATTETGIDLGQRVVDFGDVARGASWEETSAAFKKTAATLCSNGCVPFFVGGDHAVTVPVVSALAVLRQPVHVIQIDAHPDLYDTYDGRSSAHACVGARLLEMSHVASLTQIGIRTLNSEQQQFAEPYGDRLHILFARDIEDTIPALSYISPDTAVYMTVDMDGFDPAFAPSVSHPVPGGLTARQVLNFVQHGHWNLVGMDVVEVNPHADVNDQTAILAARVLHEGMGFASVQMNQSRTY